MGEKSSALFVLDLVVVGSAMWIPAKSPDSGTGKRKCPGIAVYGRLPKSDVYPAVRKRPDRER
jgi:hypothetical protein